MSTHDKPRIRKIIHLDMDAFFASVEIRDRPELATKPVIVGGLPNGRGVVSAANYIARKYGVHSGMSSARAYKLCPKGIFVQPHFEKYQAASLQVREILYTYTDMVETLASDEAWMDVTHHQRFATQIGREIKEKVWDITNLTCSVGVSYNKYLAKLASEEKKPNGFFVITPDTVHDYLMALEVKKIPGVGKVTGLRLDRHNIRTGQELYDKELYWLIQRFGKFGVSLYHKARGIDHRDVTPYRDPKSLSVERTFSEDLPLSAALMKKVDEVAEKLWKRKEKKGIGSQYVHIKIKFRNFHSISRQWKLAVRRPSYSDFLLHMKAQVRELLEKEFPGHYVRLIGMGFHQLQQRDSEKEQLMLFSEI